MGSYPDEFPFGIMEVVGTAAPAGQAPAGKQRLCGLPVLRRPPRADECQFRQKMSGGAITATNMAECWRCMQNSITQRPLTLIGKLQKLCVTIPMRNTHAPGMKPNRSRPAPGPHLRGPGRPLQVILLPSEKLCRSRIKPARPRSIRHYPCFWPSLRCGRHIGNICAHQSAGCLMNRLTHWALRVPHRLFYAGLLQNG